MKLTTIAIATLAAAAYAQTGSQPASSYTEIKAYLNLTDTQITGIQAVQKQLDTATSNLQQQIQTKETDLQTKLTAGASDAATVGRLLIDITALRKQIDTQSSPFRDQAKNLLTADQKTKLKTLEDASKLEPQIRQATQLLLLAPVTATTQGIPGVGGSGGRGPGGRGFGGPADLGIPGALPMGFAGPGGGF
jgi:hypothetical protein